LTTTNTLEKPVTVVQDEIERVAGDPSSAWVVQIGSFGDRNNAENEVKDLKEKGFPAFLSRYVNNKKAVLYRVRVGPEKDRSRAEKLAESLKKAGVNGQVVAHP
jgi:DedD protein